MAGETILQHYIFADFILPFLLMFAIVFAILEKSKILGQEAKQVNAIVALVIGLIFVGAIFPKQVVGDLVLFLTVALMVIFVFLLLYGFVASGKEGLEVESSDETLSSKEATFQMIQLNISKKKRRINDDIAAAIILQNYLDYKGASLC